MTLHVQCDSHKTCLKKCVGKNITNLETINPNDKDYRILYDPGSCWHNEHTDGEYREASIRNIENVEPTIDEIFIFMRDNGMIDFYNAREILREKAYGGKPPQGYDSWGDYWKNY